MSSAVALRRRFDRPLLATSLLAGIGFWAALPWAPYPGDALLKWLAVVAAAGLAYSRGAQLTALGLAFGSLGDVALAVDPQALLLYGMAAFALGHVVYIAAWLPDRVPWRDVSTGRRGMLLAAVLLAVAMLAVLRPFIPGPLFAPVVGYMLLLVAMTGAGLAAKRASPMLATGAVLFLLSDAVLAVRLFMLPTAQGAWLDLVVWPLYYGGQLLIAIGGAPDTGAPAAVFRQT